MLLLALLIAAPVYVQASSVRLREAPTAKSALVAEVPIGTACTRAAAPTGEWGLYECGAVKGHTKAEFFADEAPALQTLVQKALDEETSDAAARLQHLNRAIALASQGKGSEELTALWGKYRKVFVTAELQRLSGAREARQALKKQPKIKTISAKCYDSLQDCNKSLVPAGADIAFAEVEENDFVAVALQPNGQLTVTSGAVGDDTFDGGQVQGHRATYHLEQTYSSTPEPLVLQALFYDMPPDKIAGCAAVMHTTETNGCRQDAKYGTCSACEVACFKTCSACRAANVSDPACTSPLRECRKACYK